MANSPNTSELEFHIKTLDGGEVSNYVKNNNGKTIIKATNLLRRWALAKLVLRGIPSAVTKIVFSKDCAINLER